VDARTLRVERTFATPRLSSHNFLSLTPDGLLVTAGDDAMTGVDVATGHVLWQVDLRADPDPWPCEAYAVAVAVRRFYCAKQFGEVLERDLATGQLTGRQLDSQRGEPADLAVAHGDELVTFFGGYSRWRLDGSGPAARLVAAGTAAEGYDDTGRLLPVAAPHDGLISVLDVASGASLVTLGDYESARWLGTSSMLVLSDDHPPDLLDVTTGQRTRDDLAVYRPRWVFRDRSGLGRAWVLVPHPGSDNTFDLVEVDARTGSPTGRRIPVPGDALGVTPSPDGRSLWVNYFVPRAGGNISFSNLRDSGFLARLDVGTGRILDSVNDVAASGISGEGRVVTADLDGHLTERDPDSLAPVAQLAGTRGALEQLAFSDDGRILMTTGGDGSVQLYDSATWIRLAVIPSAAPGGAHQGWLRPDGQAVAVNGADGVAEWTLEPSRLAAAACETAGRNLTRTEWASYFPGQPYRRTCPDYPVGT